MITLVGYWNHLKEQDYPVDCSSSSESQHHPLVSIVIKSYFTHPIFFSFRVFSDLRSSSRRTLLWIIGVRNSSISAVLSLFFMILPISLVITYHFRIFNLSTQRPLIKIKYWTIEPFSISNGSIDNCLSWFINKFWLNRSPFCQISLMLYFSKRADFQLFNMFLPILQSFCALLSSPKLSTVRSGSVPNLFWSFSVFWLREKMKPNMIPRMTTTTITITIVEYP